MNIQQTFTITEGTILFRTCKKDSMVNCVHD